MSREEEAAKWATYYDAFEGRAPREQVLTVMNRFDPPTDRRLTAVDLGCGAGIDTLALLTHGWQVLAIDKQPEAIDRLLTTVPDHLRPRLQTAVSAFESLPTLPRVDLVYAAFSLPFCHPANFNQLWNKIVTALRPNGRFCGQLFGDRDGWATRQSMTFHSYDQIRQRLRPFTVEHLEEEERDGTTANGTPKHWHLFHIIARKAEPSLPND